jgi:hypothetical protein
VTTYLANNQIVLATKKATTEQLLMRVLTSVSGTQPLFKVSACGVGCALQISYEIREAKLRLESPRIVVDELNLDTTLKFQISLDFSSLYDCLSGVLPLPPRCITICIPFTHICWSKCLDLGNVSFPLDIPLSFSLAGLYKPRAEIVVDNTGTRYWHIYPELLFITPLLIDVGRTLQRICDAVANELPWPLSMIAGELCGVFFRVVHVIQDRMSAIAVELTDLLFKATTGWIGLQLKFVPLYKLRADAVPGTTNPMIPAVIDSLTASVNGSNELDVRFLLLPA